LTAVEVFPIINAMNSALKTHGPKLLLGITILFTYALLIMGNVVTSTGSGLECPDWPLCHGTVNPPKEIGIWFEWGHRLLGGITGTLIIFSAIYMIKKTSGAVSFLLKLVVGLVCVVVVLGGIVVLTEAPLLDNYKKVLLVSSHIIIAILIFTSMILSFRATFSGGENREKVYSLWLFGIVFFQVILGIFVRYSGASLSCPDWPLCQGSVLPPAYTSEVLLQYVHRLFAYGIFGLTLWRLVMELMSGEGRAAPHVLTFCLVATQATIGVLMIWTKLFLPFVILHGAVGFLVLGWVTFRAGPYLVPPVKEVEA